MIIERLIKKVEREIAALNERRQKLQAAAQLINELTAQEHPSREKQTAVSRQAAVKQCKELSGKKPAGKAQQKPAAPATAKSPQKNSPAPNKEPRMRVSQTRGSATVKASGPPGTR